MRFDVQEPFARAPITVDDHFPVAAGGTLVVEAPGVPINDYDPDGDAATAQSFFLPQNGDLSLNTAGTFEYVPDPGFVGTDTFVYSSTDGETSSTPTQVTLVVITFGDIATGVLTPPTPGGFALEAPTRNPFNPSTELRSGAKRAVRKLQLVK